MPQIQFTTIVSVIATANIACSIINILTSIRWTNENKYYKTLLELVQ